MTDVTDMSDETTYCHDICDTLFSTLSSFSRYNPYENTRINNDEQTNRFTLGSAIKCSEEDYEETMIAIFKKFSAVELQHEYNEERCYYIEFYCTKKERFIFVLDLLTLFGTSFFEKHGYTGHISPIGVLHKMFVMRRDGAEVWIKVSMSRSTSTLVFDIPNFRWMMDCEHGERWIKIAKKYGYFVDDYCVYKISDDLYDIDIVCADVE